MVTMMREVLMPERWGPIRYQPEERLPDLLRRLRQERGWSQKEVAVRLGMSSDYQPVVSRWERGAVPELDTMQRLAQVYRVPLETILRAATFSQKLGKRTVPSPLPLPGPALLIPEEQGFYELFTDLLTLDLTPVQREIFSSIASFMRSGGRTDEEIRTRLHSLIDDMRGHSDTN